MDPFLARAIDRVYFRFLTLMLRPRRRYSPQAKALEFYRDPSLLSNPENVYAPPRSVPQVCTHLSHKIQIFARYHFAFQSQYRPLSSAYLSQYHKYSACHTVYGRYYRLHHRRTNQALIHLPGWMEHNTFLRERLIINLICKQLGFDLVSIIYPFHLQRTPPEASFSGEYFLSGDIVRTIEAFRQAVTDVMSIITWLKERGMSKIGLIGFSLGGFITGLLLSLDRRIDFAIPCLSHGSVSEILWQTSLLRKVKEDILLQGVNYQQLEELCQIISPQSFTPKLKSEDILMINGLYDVLIRVEKVKELWEKWGRPQTVWYPAGHITFYLYVGWIFQQVKEFLHRKVLEARSE